MPTTQPLGRNSIAESSLPPNLRKKRKSGSTNINNTTNITNINNIKKTIKLVENVAQFKPISIIDGVGYKANKTDKPTTAISLEAGIDGAEIEIAKTGDIVKFDSSVFTANELIWLGNSNDLTQEPDFETEFNQILGMAISEDAIFVNIETILFE